MAWSDAAREASAETRRAHAHGRIARQQRAKATYKPSTAHKHAISRAGEMRVIKALRARQRAGTRGTHPVDVMMQRAGKTHGVEVKTLVDNKNNKITMHPSSRARKTAWAHSNHARLHTVVVDSRAKNKMYYHKGVGSFRLGSLQPVSSAAHLRRLMGL